jgi:ribosomal protein S18 acetylase RimI-like enzyme
MTIDPLSPHETDACVALWEEAGLTRPWNDPRADIATALNSGAAAILAAREGGRIVGTIMVGFDGHRGWFYYLAVANDRRGQGLGRALVLAAEVWLKARGAPAVRLMVRGDNAQVTGFYAALGYELSDTVVLGRRLDEDTK